MTMPAFLQERYGTRWLKIAAAFVIFLFLVPYSASVYTGLAYLFEEVFEVDYTLALWVMAVLTGVYLVLGGYFAVARNDLIQGLVMIVGVILMVGYVVRAPEVGGFGEAYDKLKAAAPPTVEAWPPWNLSPFSWDAFWASPGVVLLSLVILTSLGVWGLPQMVHKFYAIRDTKVVRPAIVISTLFAALMAFGAYYVGALSRLFPGTGDLAAAKRFDEIMPTVLTAALPEALVAVILLLVLSASMSTLAGLVMISGSAIAVDLVKGEIKKDLGKGAEVMLLRALIVVFIVLSVVLAQQKWQLIVNLMALSWGLVAGCFLGPFVWGLYWRRVSAAAVWVNIVDRAGDHGRAGLLVCGRPADGRARPGAGGGDDGALADRHAAREPGDAGPGGRGRGARLRRGRERSVGTRAGSLRGDGGCARGLFATRASHTRDAGDDSVSRERSARSSPASTAASCNVRNTPAAIPWRAGGPSPVTRAPCVRCGRENAPARVARWRDARHRATRRRMRGAGQGTH